jgi:hypothetical protein
MGFQFQVFFSILLFHIKVKKSGGRGCQNHEGEEKILALYLNVKFQKKEEAKTVLSNIISFQCKLFN